MPPGVYHNKPIIGLAGGVGSGKSFVARVLAEQGYLVIDSDRHVSEAYRRADVRRTLRKWWGKEIFLPDGQLDRAAVAKKAFGNPAQRKRLEKLLHPLVARMRQRVMRQAAREAQVLGFVWDAPLLFEASLAPQCDAVLFVHAPRRLRLKRVRQERGWTAAELARREKSQLPLDKKRKMSDYMVRNTAGADQVRRQVRDLLSRIRTSGGDPA
jgi:dephospho-CoA kinase